MKITIFTPTYNRSDKLKVLYESLKLQVYKNFEWIIVDDGSTDNTEFAIKEIQTYDNQFDVIYYKQKNSGKHIAINKGVEMASGDLFFIVDSDDYLVPNSLTKIVEYVSKLPAADKYAGVAGLKGFSESVPVGATFDGDYFDCTSLERAKYNINGDKAEVFFTEIIKKYPFPKIENENFLTETVVWYRIANDGYKFRWFNEVIYICEYCEDGLTKKGSKFYDNYNGFILQVSEEIKYKQIKFKVKIKQLLICFGYAKYKNYDLKVLAEKFGFSRVKCKILRNVGYFILKYIYKKTYGD